MTCQFCNTEPGTVVTIFNNPESTHCFNCSHPSEVFEIKATYEGHIFIDGILYANLKYERDRICAGCGDIRRYCSMLCDDGGISKKFFDLALVRRPIGSRPLIISDRVIVSKSEGKDDG